MCVHTQGEVAWLLPCRGREVSSIPPLAVSKKNPLGWGAPEHWAAFSQYLRECFEPTLFRALLRLWIHGWLGGVDWSCSITSITMWFSEKDCQLHASGLRMPCLAHLPFCFSPREVKLIPFPVFQGSVEIAADECKVLSACCHVRAVI